MSVTFYGLKSCDTCRKAMKAFQNKELDVAYVDVRADGVPQDQLQRIFEAFNNDVINRRSTTWRSLSDAEKAGEPLKLLADHPTLMKRPVIEKDGALYLGWGQDVQDAVLK